MIRGGADEVRLSCCPEIMTLAVYLTFGTLQIVLETEYDNVASLALYERLGFLREKRLHRFYLNVRRSVIWSFSTYNISCC